MKVTFVGTSSCTPDVGSDTASFVINDRHLVDTGWCAVLRMREYGIDPLGLASVVLTHFHHDHYMGLVQLLFYATTRGRHGAVAHPLHVIGPEAHLARVFHAALDFLQLSRFPELEVNHALMPLRAGQGFELDGLQWETFAARHVSGKGAPEEALCYKVTEPATGVRIAFTGDTSFHPPIAGFARGVRLLIHDVAHTSARDAATIARTAEVERLLLIHYAQSEAASLLAAAREVFPRSFLAGDGSIMSID